LRLDAVSSSIDPRHRRLVLGIEEAPMAEPLKTEAFPQREDGRAWPAQGNWTYEDYLRLPDDGRRYEVLRGVLYVSPAPSVRHQFAVAELGRLLGNFVAKHELGLLLPAPVDILLPRNLATPVQPDLVFLPGPRRAGAWGANFAGVPPLVIEVLSPSSRRVDQKVKLAIYQEAGVLEYWLVDPQERAVVVYVLSEDRKSYIELHRASAGQTVGSSVLSGLEIELDEIFLPR
jgi:Uma2 family endonuclease